ncbi:MAG: FHA domain-containing protein [Acidimicrobiia bacterium]|nr:FHA domain-containing protein [Acidimicrobiia bacterium]
MASSMTRCAEGHYFDTGKHVSCPWCEKGEGAPDGKTRKLEPSPAPAPPEPRRESSAGATRRLDQTPTGTRPVVGWLVCVEGPDKGRDFRLHPEKNFLGRDSSMDVCLSQDAAISRHRHATVIYDPKKKDFWLQPGDAEGLVYLNGNLVNTPTQVSAYELVELGNSKLVLVPFDNERYPL